jgi:hypothetical protein
MIFSWKVNLFRCPPSPKQEHNCASLPYLKKICNYSLREENTEVTI